MIREKHHKTKQYSRLVREIQTQSNRNIIYDLFQFQEPKQIQSTLNYQVKENPKMKQTTIPIRYTLTTNNTTKNCRF